MNLQQTCGEMWRKLAKKEGSKSSAPKSKKADTHVSNGRDNLLEFLKKGPMMARDICGLMYQTHQAV